ncbi:unnamed protein product [Phaeothamnion confervicola]
MSGRGQPPRPDLNRGASERLPSARAEMRRTHHVLLLLQCLRHVVGLFLGGAVRFSSTKLSPTMGLAFKRRRPANRPGNLFVDESCTDCDACRWLAPNTFHRSGLGSIVVAQPTTEEDLRAAYRAMISCPVGAIRTMRGDPFVKEVLNDFPAPVDAVALPGVYLLGHHHRITGATPYLIVRPGDLGNVMVDAPRYSARLAEGIEALGGVGHLVFTHCDTAGDHRRWKERFPELTRVVHRFDLRPETRGVELLLDGDGPWPMPPAAPRDSQTVVHSLRRPRRPRLSAEPLATAAAAEAAAGAPNAEAAAATTVEAAAGAGPERGVAAAAESDVQVLYVPGHTFGSVAVLFSPPGGEAALFSGDCVGYSTRLERLDGFSRDNRAGIDRQATSIRELADGEGIADFRWLLAARGAPTRFRNAHERRTALAEAARLFKEAGKTFI